MKLEELFERTVISLILKPLRGRSWTLETSDRFSGGVAGGRVLADMLFMLFYVSLCVAIVCLLACLFVCLLACLLVAAWLLRMSEMESASCVISLPSCADVAVSSSTSEVSSSVSEDFSSRVAWDRAEHPQPQLDRAGQRVGFVKVGVGLYNNRQQ